MNRKGKNMIYLDNAATTYPKPEDVYKAVDFANRNLAFNAGRGKYKAAHASFSMIEDTRLKLARLINADPENVVFSSSATESLNQIIYGIDFSEGDNVYISPFEHNSIIRPLYELKKKINIEIRILPFDKDTWEPDLTQIANLFSLYKPKAIFLSHISNVTGYILPYKEIFDLGTKFESINVLDCAQSYGVLNPTNSKGIVDYVVFDGHKSLYATFGIAGFICLDNKISLNTWISGGTGSDSLNHYMTGDHYSKFEAGSQNSVAIAGLNKSLDWLHNNDISKKLQELTEYLIENLKKLPNIKIYLPSNPNKNFGIVSLNVNNYNCNDVGTILNDEFEICVRTGYHCAPFVHEFLNTKECLGTVRISMSFFNTKNDLDALINALKTF